jgi:transposase-like protein
MGAGIDMNLLNVTRTFTTEDQALDYLIAQRWPNGVRCLACDHDKVYAIATVGKTKKPCRLFECGECKLHFSATTGTLFHDSHLPLTKWFMAMALMVEAKKGISANQIARHLGVQYKTAWYLCHRIRKAMQELSEPLGGQGQVVEIDETYLGGRKHNHRKTTKEIRERKVKVFGMVERGGRVRLQKVENLKADTLRQLYQQNVSPNAGKVFTDGSPTYHFVVPKDKHVPTNHEQELRDTGTVTNKTIEGAFSLFKRGVVGSYHKLSQDHLDSYLGEFCWRYNRRKMQPWMFQTLLRELVTKKPMTYKTLTRETF